MGPLNTSSEAIDPAIPTRGKWSRVIAPLSLLASLFLFVLPAGYGRERLALSLVGLGFLVLSIVWGILARQWILVGIELGTIALFVGLNILLRLPGTYRPEPAAVSNLRTISTAEVTYLSSSGGHYGTIEGLIDARLVDETFIGTKAGYRFSVTLNETRSGFTAEAVPVSINPGRYDYYSVDDGVIRYSTNASLAPAGKAGKPIE